MLVPKTVEVKVGNQWLMFYFIATDNTLVRVTLQREKDEQYMTSD
ncbi:hypothetical protein Q4601_09875 [Shewanella sp. 1_MG-2023]|jgi:hypothetical protein|nr:MULTISPECIES: hypothetical protein [Shewanella]MDO6611125.1 hypothetical protein [Shewanella sp. 7_MG-2023]MDO6770998.1 hypothetical protein [Shewanella sp. 2_MG-2023]MDO6794615.1 hypothetical protein [Shewanella sp. 1_MG-2023]